jgi:MFS family permease
LVPGRAVQAIGALFVPAVLSTLASTFTEPAERGKAFGVFGAVAASGGSVGLILGGALTEYLDWRWCLCVNDVLAAIVLAGALAFLPKSDRGVGVRLGWPGIAAVVAGLECVVYGFSSAAGPARSHSACFSGEFFC